jgi:hypothetical protein
MLETSPGHTVSRSLRAARQYGMLKYRQGYSIPHMVEETRLLQTSIYPVVEQHLQELEVSTIVSDPVGGGAEGLFGNGSNPASTPHRPSDFAWASSSEACRSQRPPLTTPNRSFKGR